MVGQDAFEAALRSHAKTYASADLRFNTELVTFEQDRDRVIATLRDRNSDGNYEDQAAFLIAAD
jgi:putative polyketide hydroxylase